MWQPDETEEDIKLKNAGTKIVHPRKTGPDVSGKNITEEEHPPSTRPWEWSGATNRREPGDVPSMSYIKHIDKERED
jgi:hypothetical protein